MPVVDPIQEEVFWFVTIGDIEVMVGCVAGVDIIRSHVGIYQTVAYSFICGYHFSLLFLFLWL